MHEFYKKKKTTNKKALQMLLNSSKRIEMKTQKLTKKDKQKHKK